MVSGSAGGFCSRGGPGTQLAGSLAREPALNFGIPADLRGDQGCLPVHSICISFLKSEGEYFFFMWLSAMCIILSVNFLLIPFPPFSSSECFSFLLIGK